MWHKMATGFARPFQLIFLWHACDITSMRIRMQTSSGGKHFLRTAFACGAIWLGGGSSSPAQPISSQTFTNPVLPSGADPWVACKDGFYYYMNSTRSNLTIWKTRSIPDLRQAQKAVVWTPPPTGPFSAEIWAPEIHFLQDKWYIYFAADDGKNSTHRIWVLENASPDPVQGQWTMKGKLSDASDKWAIDASVFENKGRLYALWSGWEGETNGTQNIYIAAMKNPWTIEGARSKLSSPAYPWETFGDLGPRSDSAHVNVNEGPEILPHDDRLFLIYAASGCWTDNYCLGMMMASIGSDLLDPGSWEKYPRPVLSQLPEAQAYGTGHCGFFKSPDGKEDWIVFHANPKPGEGCGGFRAPRAQPIIWRADGTPDFGQPIPLATPIRRPSGEAPVGTTTTAPIPK
jgi:GH43 family beta-xylosidase